MPRTVISQDAFMNSPLGVAAASAAGVGATLQHPAVHAAWVQWLAEQFKVVQEGDCPRCEGVGNRQSPVHLWSEFFRDAIVEQPSFGHIPPTFDACRGIALHLLPSLSVGNVRPVAVHIRTVLSELWNNRQNRLLLEVENGDGRASLMVMTITPVLDSNPPSQPNPPRPHCPHYPAERCERDRPGGHEDLADTGKRRSGVSIANEVHVQRVLSSLATATFRTPAPLDAQPTTFTVTDPACPTYACSKAYVVRLAEHIPGEMCRGTWRGAWSLHIAKNLPDAILELESQGYLAGNIDEAAVSVSPGDPRLYLTNLESVLPFSELERDSSPCTALDLRTASLRSFFVYPAEMLIRIRELQGAKCADFAPLSPGSRHAGGAHSGSDLPKISTFQESEDINRHWDLACLQKELFTYLLHPVVEETLATLYTVETETPHLCDSMQKTILGFANAVHENVETAVACAKSILEGRAFSDGQGGFGRTYREFEHASQTYLGIRRSARSTDESSPSDLHSSGIP